LTSGGHNAGIVSGAVHPRRRHRVHTWLNDTETLNQEAWLEATAPVPGSWWPVWERGSISIPARNEPLPPALGSPQHGYAPIADAPGDYVRQK